MHHSRYCTTRRISNYVVGGIKVIEMCHRGGGGGVFKKI